MNRARFKFLWAVLSFRLFEELLINVESLKLENANDSNVKFEKTADGNYKLSMDENVANVTLFIITEVDGDNPILKFMDLTDVCSAFSNGYHIQKIDGQFKVFLNLSLDYEQTNCQKIAAEIDDAQSICMFELDVNNLDDNEPQLILPSSKCILEENRPYTRENTTCVLTMTDEDGMMEDTIFTIEDSTAAELFDVGFNIKPKHDEKETKVSVFLRDGKTLDFEDINMYVFSVLAQETVEKNDVQIVIRVKDMPDQPPKWTSMFTTQQFEENIDQVFNVKAVDGDVGINNSIRYEIEKNPCENYHCQITINKNDGKIDVRNVDREELDDTSTIAFKIWAIECDDSNKTSLDVTFFILDQDDNDPLITISGDEDNKVVIAIDENWSQDITKFSVEDMDLGDNGTYSIKLSVPEKSPNYPDAFKVIPTTGYQEGDFTLTVANSTYLDYEDPIWKVITFQFQAIEKANDTHVDSKTIIINLNDLNDEPPIFSNTTDTIEVLENITKGELIFDAIAIDKDAGDIVTYQIVGVWGEKLDISDTGKITPKMDDVFDYEQLQQVVIQIRATDKGETHKTYKTLTINVLDVDDEPPSIEVGRNRITIKENSISHTQLEDAVIILTDPDTKPKLSIAIDWSKSFITKNSGVVTVDEKNKWQCFALTVKKHDLNAQLINASLEINDFCSPDFELFDAITISLIGTDENTVKRDPNTTGSILVNIEDVNDNPPVFIPSSLADLETSDGTKGGAKIGTISAHDVDLNSIIAFSIKPVDSTADWVDINQDSGLLTVKKEAIIDDDIPPRSHISYVITACDNDNVHCPYVTIQINLIDINDQKPRIIGKTAQKVIKEKSTSGTILTFTYEDDDRDAPFNVVDFRFNSNLTTEAGNRFKISQNGKTGTISVHLRNGCILDRDYGDSKYVLPILAYDNPTGMNQNSDSFNLEIILEDINDHAPQITSKSIEVSENLKKEGKLGLIVAEDPDEGDNGKVKFEILDVTPFSRQNPKILDKSSFSIKSINDKSAEIISLEKLEGYYGQYNITIRTEDYGLPPQSKNDNIIELTVTKYNFKAPVFVYPESDNMKIVLEMEQAPSLNSPLKLFNGTDLPDFEVDDKQNHKWEVTFQLTEENGSSSGLFTLLRSNDWKTRLQLLRNPTEEDAKEHILKIQASVKNEQQEGEQPTSVIITIKASFFNSSEQPAFSETSYGITFEEKSLGEPQPIPQATFSSELDIQPYYSLLDYTDIFEVNPENGSVGLKVIQDVEKNPSYKIRVGAASSISVHPTEEKSILNVQVTIEDINDHIPIFFPSKFVGACLKSYNKDSTILTINATDEDPRDNGKLHYSIDEIKCVENLNLPKPAFKIGESDGKINPKFTVTSDMSGYCSFQVYVKDNADNHNTVHTVHTSVQINIISDEELVEITFLNDDTYVNQQQEEITSKINEIFKKFNYNCYLADLKYNPDSVNTTADFFFLDENMTPIKKSYILGNLSDIDNYNSLYKSLRAIKVYLGNFSLPPEELEDNLKLWLIITTIVLATLLMLLSVAFFFRNRVLTQRISNLSTTKFGSQDSGLNRAGVTAPTTNRNAMEGSNPVFNSESYVKEVETDRQSIMSSDSDLFGVEDNPEFDNPEIDI